ncbi:MAG TPA: hypothetical protein VL551_32220 [Actinospica sp.]|jgi:hypothetical protein|nr:hypothetical protein [Actinospica sp.]
MSQLPVDSTIPVAWGLLKPLHTTQPACCCAASPTVRVLVPFDGGQVEVAELLLCSHHFRCGIASLQRIGAVVFDASGALIMPRVWRLDVHVVVTV